jgi:AraC-like DNA-binding protein
MALEFEFVVGQEFHFTNLFAQRFGATVSGDQLTFPESLGQGYIREVYLDHGVALCMHRHTLVQPLTLRRLEAPESADFLSIKFSGRRAHPRDSNAYSVELTTCNLFSTITLPADMLTDIVVINIPRQHLLALLKITGGCEQQHATEEAHHCLRQILAESPSFVLHEAMTPELERVLEQLAEIDEHTPLASLLYQTRTLEMIYLLFARILRRPTRTSLPVHQQDAEKIYAVRSALLSDLHEPPSLAQLAEDAGMSLTKMKQLFRQVFGDSIYNYYQTARMEEAARLLLHLSVSEAGYEVGFTNLSHFTRLFERHHRLKPKRYQESLRSALPV